MIKKPQIAGPDFDRALLMRKGAEQYRADKAKAGSIGGSMVKGSIRPWSKKNLAIAVLHRKSAIGKKYTVTALETFSKYDAGSMYAMEVVDTKGEGVVRVGGLLMTIRQVVEKFKVHKNASN